MRGRQQTSIATFRAQQTACHEPRHHLVPRSRPCQLFQTLNRYLFHYQTALVQHNVDAMSNFGALTTAFTPPAACSATNVYLSRRDGSSMYMQAPTDTQLCFPSGYRPQVYGGYFSPAQCPVGYTTACISLKTIGTDLETIVTCCPR